MLQAGTSHNLGTNFAKAFDTKFLAESGEWEYVFQTSWGMSTRMLGALASARSCVPLNILIILVLWTDNLLHQAVDYRMQI